MHSTKSSTKDATTASDSDPDKGGIPPENTDSHSDYDDDEPADEDIDVEELEDSILSGCICGAFRKAHTRDCPETSTPDRLNWGTKKKNLGLKTKEDPSAAL